MQDPNHNSPEAGEKTVAELELLAPAGDWSALEAALEAGASAVYFGMTTLNARRWAKNFQPDEFARAVEMVHAHHARAYLTLNIDLTERELGQAARLLELARECGTNAVLVRDPALLALRPEFPGIEFHLSSLTCMANSADVAAAGAMGASRVVLAREMTLAEIAAASKVPGVQTEVFIQGALCFSISGRCLLSSWVGGRSGNRGACTSPCRVPYRVGGESSGTPLSMHDLATIDRLAELRKAGVTTLKIEGRLKNAAWVRQAVSLYRKAIDHPELDSKELLEEARQLEAHTGRALTSNDLDGDRSEAGSDEAPSVQEAFAEGAPPASDEPEELQEPEKPDVPLYNLAIDVADRGIQFRFKLGSYATEWSIPKTMVRRVHKAVPIGQLLQWLPTQTIQGHQLGESSTNAPDFLIVPRAANALMDKLSAVIRLAKKSPENQAQIDLSPRIRELLEASSAASANRRHLGDKPTRVRLEAGQVASFLKQIRPSAVIVEGITAKSLSHVLHACGRVPLIAALPPVFFEDDVPAMRSLVEACAEAKVTVEANTWGGWWLAKEAGARIEAGPALPVLNSLAAGVLRELGFENVTLSIEADRRQLEALTAHCPVPCSLVVFGRPPLMTSRVELGEGFLNELFADRRGVRMSPRRERGLWVIRPEDPFDLRATTNDRIRVAHLVVDLVGSPEPMFDWYNLPEERGTFRFNYDRTLA